MCSFFSGFISLFCYRSFTTIGRFLIGIVFLFLVFVFVSLFFVVVASIIVILSVLVGNSLNNYLHS